MSERTLVDDLNHLGFAATAQALADGRATPLDALEHIAERVPSYERAQASPFRPGTVGEADHRRITAWLVDARDALARHERELSQTPGQQGDER